MGVWAFVFFGLLDAITPAAVLVAVLAAKDTRACLLRHDRVVRGAHD